MLTHLIHPEIAEKGLEVFFGNVDYTDKELSDEGTIFFWYHDENDNPMEWSISMKLYYEHCLACDLDPRMKAERCVNVDEGWIARQLKKGTV